MISVDGDMSTNDTCVVLANGASGVRVDQGGETAAAFERALAKAQGIAAGDRAKVEEVLPTYIRNVDPEVSKKLTMPGFPTANDPQRIQKLIDLMKEQGQLTNRIDATTIVFQP
jgi:NitT/TauT family transport system substrate-binding protein